MKPFPNRTSIFQRIRLSVARELSSALENLQRSCRLITFEGTATVILRPVNGATVSSGGRYATDYYNHSVPAATGYLPTSPEGSRRQVPA
jgi:hypothetical protein